MGTVSKMERRKALLALRQHPAAATIPTSPHTISDVRAYAVPLSGTEAATAAALHVAIPNFFIVELPSTGAGSVKPHDGFRALPKGSGWGSM